MIYGLTGGMGSGKSTVAEELKKAGCDVFDADAIYKELTLPGKPLVLELEEAFGRDISDSKHVLNRRVLSEKAFASKKNLKLLNKITHRAVNKEMNRLISESKADIIFLDVPLLFESGGDKRCAEVWLVTAPMETRIKRVTKRDGITREEAEKRIAAQMSDEEKIKLADVVIENDKGKRELKLKLKKLIKERLQL
ncbi:MAG: dephospho-CoA kinase [Firmicutes bacterium]|nr:dephospho-CoA kinase [Bacillota bacterium]